MYFTEIAKARLLVDCAPWLETGGNLTDIYETASN